MKFSTLVIRPGVFIALLALSSIVYALYIEHPTPTQKACWIAVFALLTIAEIIVISREGHHHDIEMAAARDDARAKFRITLDKFENLTRLANAAPQEALRRKLLDLSNAILDLLYDRLEREPVHDKTYSPLTSVGVLMGANFRFEDMDSRQKRALLKTMQYADETVSAYKERYAARVAAIKRELADNGVMDARFDEYTAKPSLVHVAMIAELLGELSEHVPHAA